MIDILWSEMCGHTHNNIVAADCTGCFCFFCIFSAVYICAFELWGQGANQFTYYVTNDLAGEWRKLPDIKPNQAAARVFLFTTSYSKFVMADEPSRRLDIERLWHRGATVKCTLGRSLQHGRSRGCWQEMQDPRTACFESILTHILTHFTTCI